MYDKALEQLIDAVIADGVITDQERKVVYKKAATLGIDQDEIEVYLEGRLDAFNKTNQPQSGKHGTVKSCPNCGAVVDSFSGKCSECGYEFSNVQSNSSVRLLISKLEQIEKGQRDKKGFWDEPEFETYRKKAELISNFPIPNTKEDLIEFVTLCAAHTSLDEDESHESTAEYKAWKQKSHQVKTKAELLFPNDKEVEFVLVKLKETKKNFAQKFISGLKIWGWLIGFFLVGIIAVLVIDKNVESYTDTQIGLINSLPTPNKDNYMDCYRQFNKIVWTKPKEESGDWRDSYQAFKEAQSSYQELLLSAFKAAGVSNEDIPRSLFPNFSDSETNKSSYSTSSDMPSKELIDKEEEIEVEEIESMDMDAVSDN